MQVITKCDDFIRKCDSCYEIATVHCRALRK